MDDIFTSFSKDLMEYLESKFPDTPKHVLMETQMYVANKAIVLVMDEIRARDNEWKKYMTNSKSAIQKRLKDLNNVRREKLNS
jgi:hypothetical protein